MANTPAPKAVRDLFNQMLVAAAQQIARCQTLKETQTMVKVLADAAIKAASGDLLDREYNFITESDAKYKREQSRGDAYEGEG